VSRIQAQLLRRKFRYDESIEEFFVQTADTVKVKKSELEKYQSMEVQDAEQAWLPPVPFPLLMATQIS
jgi:hypothetical protein